MANDVETSVRTRAAEVLAAGPGWAAKKAIDTVVQVGQQKVWFDGEKAVIEDM